MFCKKLAMQFIFTFCVSCSSLCVMVDFYLLELLEGNLIFRNWQVVGFKIPKCVWCGRWADCGQLLGLQYSVCNSILIHVQLRFWRPSAAWNIFFALSFAQQDNKTVFENYRGAFCCYLYYRLYIYTDMRPVFLISAIPCCVMLI